MKVLHYSLGFPPYRTGGLTRYCIDLMKTQKEEGFEVALLWPGRMSFVGKEKISIKKSIYNEENINIISYELCNPLPVPLDEGIKEADRFTAACNMDIYCTFLEELMPDVIHIHTLMGIHKQFIQAAQKLSIRIVFTTHDYFGLCPKVTLFCNGQPCEDLKCGGCVQCNNSALSINKIKLMQSRIYRNIKNTNVVQKVRTKHRKNFFERDIDSLNHAELSWKKIKEYQKLRYFYISMLSEMDMIHFNSTVSQKIYSKYFKPKKSIVMNVIHRGIADHRKKKCFNEIKLRIVFLAAPKPFKGFEILIQALDSLWTEGNRNFELYSYSISGKYKPYLYEQDGFSQDELPQIFDNADILIAPSLWYETFGFTVLEALSYGVPVIVTENVGAKDIIPDGAGIILKTADTKELRSVIKNLTAEQLRSMNQAIVDMAEFPNPLVMTKLLYEKCYIVSK